MSGRRATLLLGLVFAVGCGARVADTHEDPPDPIAAASPATSEAMNELDISAWEGRCVIAQGYAVAQKIGPKLDLGGPSIGVVFDDGGDWPVPLGSRVRVEGRVAERADLPVFIPDPNEPIVQGMPVEPGTDLEQARRRWVIEAPKLLSARSFAEVEAELEAKLGETVALPGILWSRNDSWWFSYDGVDLHLDRAKQLVFEQHGEAFVIHGKLSRERRPRIDQLGLHDDPEKIDSFVIRVASLEPHPSWALEPCPNAD